MNQEVNTIQPNQDSDYIPSELYNQIAKCLPIVSVEALIVIDDALLFLKRNNQPAKGQWWFAGGRVKKGETLEQTLRREVKEETGLKVNTFKLIKTYSRIFPERHDITIAYLCTCKKSNITLNNEHSEYALFKELPKGIHPYLVETIRDSQWQNSK